MDELKWLKDLRRRQLAEVGRTEARIHELEGAIAPANIHLRPGWVYLRAEEFFRRLGF